jgi:hypothetical protein
MKTPSFKAVKITTEKTQVKVVLQGSVESFEEYETRLNDILSTIKEDKVIVFPCADQSGRICSIINILKRSV